MAPAESGIPRAVREGFVSVGGAELFYRDVGAGRTLIVIHGGPDFDHTYLLPDLDRLADGYRLVYYDQRGRGRSRGAWNLDEVGIEQWVADLDAVRQHLQLESVALLGHSWGALVALHYALAHPQHVAQMVLLNSAPASSADHRLTRAEIQKRRAPHAARLDALAASAAYLDGEPDAVAAYYRVVFSMAFSDPSLVDRLRLQWTQDDIVRGRAIEVRLMQTLYADEAFTLLPRLARVQTPTFVIHGDHDHVPVACAAHIAQALPASELLVIPHCGHFAYIEAPETLRAAIDRFFAGR